MWSYAFKSIVLNIYNVINMRIKVINMRITNKRIIKERTYIIR